jgi:predicted DNA-binding antitoxin AbrB/MazE fold protein
MTLVVDATYEDGVLKPSQPLPLKEHEAVRLTVQSQSSPILEAYGMMAWTGDAETLERFALGSEFDPQEDG